VAEQSPSPIEGCSAENHQARKAPLVREVWGGDLGAALASHCQFCGRRLEKDGYHFICHVCGANYCYIHMRRHDGAHPRVPQVLFQT
jgi:hypothetical protein